MKKKGITVWEQHLERIVLGVAILFFLGFGGWQLMRSPNEVDGIAPADVAGEVSTAEEQLNAALTREISDVPSYTTQREDFQARLGEGLGENGTALALAPKVGLGGVASGETGADLLYVEPSLPAPQRVIVQTDYDALADTVVSELPALRERFPDRPYDLGWTTIAARVDMAAFREQFRQPGDDARLAIPENWYGGRVEIVDVRIERQQAIGDGWSDSVVVAALPGGVSFRELLTENTPNARDAIRDDLIDLRIQRAVVQPEFLPTMNSTWSAPDPLAESVDAEALAGLDEEEIRIAELGARLARDRRELARALVRLEELGGSDPREREEEEGTPPGGDDPGAGGSSPGFGPGGGSPGRRSPSGGGRQAPGGIGPGGGGTGGGDASREQRRRERSEQQRAREIKQFEGAIIKLDRRITRTEQDLRGLGIDPDASGSDEVAEATDPFAADQLAIWGFDIDVAYGSVYRYRVAVDVLNPFFRRKLDLSSEQETLAESLRLSSATSEWSEPVEVLRPTSFFVTEARPEDGDLGLGRVKADVFRFYGGRWWQESFTVQPGDVIGGLKRTPRDSGPDAPDAIDYGTGWYVVDVRADLQADDDLRDEGLGARVMVQRIDSPEFVEDLSPAAMDDLRRRQLVLRVEQAEAAADLESSSAEEG